MACFFVGNQSKNSAKYKGNSKPFFTAVCGVFGMQHPSCGSHFPRGRNLEWFGGHWEDTTGFYGWCLLWYRHIGMDVSFQLRKTLWVICYKIFICPVFFLTIVLYLPSKRSSFQFCFIEKLFAFLFIFSASDACFHTYFLQGFLCSLHIE